MEHRDRDRRGNTAELVQRKEQADEKIWKSRRKNSNNRGKLRKAEKKNKTDISNMRRTDARKRKEPDNTR